VGTALLCGFPFLLLRPNSHRLPNVLMAVLIGSILVVGFPQAKPESFLDIQEADYIPQAIAQRGLAVTTTHEYEPIWVQQRPSHTAAPPVTLVSGEARILSARPSPTRFEIQADVLSEAKLGVNVFYFPGWTLYVDGDERPIDVSNPQGLVEFALEPGSHQVRILFHHTPVRLWSTWLSLLSAVLLLLSVWLLRAHQRRVSVRSAH
jgi:hypothetical protein